MADYQWPDAQHRKLIGKRFSRVDGPDKVSGRAKYNYDVHPPEMLFGKILRSPYAHARIISVDTSAAEKMPGVKAVKVLQGPRKEIHWEGDEIVAVAAVDEPTAEDALRAIKVQYEPLPFMVDDLTEPKGAVEDTGPISGEDLEDMMDNQVPPPQIVEQVRKKGISFQPTQEVLDRMRRERVPETVIKAIEEAQYKPGAPKPKSPYKKDTAVVTGNPDAAFADPEAVISEGMYGAHVITHCCLESHGASTWWPEKDKLEVRVSTQNVSGIAGQLAGPMEIPASNIHMHQDHIGGGFGSKFSPDRWTVAAAQLSQMAGGKPVRIFLERDAELKVAGSRPSAFARIKVAAKKDGTLTGWDSQSWGTGGPGGGGAPPMPYVFGTPSAGIPNIRKQHTAVLTNQGPSRAWRAPNHPQAAVLTMCALEDLAAKLNMDPVDLFLKNIALTGPRAEIYTDELKVADELMGWKKRWHPRGDKTPGPLKRGLGVSMHTWGGRGHESHCDLTIHPDGAVDLKMGTQDLGTGTRTAIMMVAAETLGLPLESINLQIGDTNYPMSGGSGGSTTIGGVSSSTRRASVNALNMLFEKVAPALNTTPDQLEAVDQTIRVKGNPSQALSWKQACQKLGAMPLTASGENKAGMKPDLTNSGVGGVQMADVTVDTETGVVKVNKMVAVQDCGLIINLKTAESQCYGALIMGISYALYEERILDPVTGKMLNADLEFYRLAGYGDVPELVVHMMTTGKNYDQRGVIGLGEPPVISPGAAISNAVANAIGVRVPVIPLTPDRVLAALNTSKGGG